MMLRLASRVAVNASRTGSWRSSGPSATCRTRSDAFRRSYRRPLLGGALPRLHELGSGEVTWQSERLIGAADELDDTVARLKSDPTAAVAVVDTNVFLHFHPLEQFDWTFVAPPPVRIVVPVRVIEELGNTKLHRKPDVAHRA